MVGKAVCHQKKSGQKKARANRTQINNKCNRLSQQLKSSQRLVEKWKKRHNRLLLQREKGSPSPRKVVRRLLTQEKTKIKQKLLFSEVLQKQLRHNYNGCRSEKEKQMYAKVIGGHFLKKYKLGYMAS